MPIDYGSNNVATSGNVNVSGVVSATSGVFTNLTLNGAVVSISGHTHTASSITDFNEAVDDRVGSGLFVAGTGINLNYNDGSNSFTVSVSGLINNPTNNRILTSRDNTTTGIDAESNLTFDGSTLSVTGVINIDNLRLDSNTLSSTNSNGNIIVSPTGTGKVGVRTVSPTHTLHVNGSGYVASGLQIDGSLGINKSPYFSLDVQGIIAVTNQAYGQVIIADDYIGGDLGVIAVYGGSDHILACIRDTNDGSYYYGYGGPFSSEYLVISQSGLVGIGTTSPSYNLDVIGTGNFSQNLLVNGTGVSLNGHPHVVTDITDFSTGVADEVNTTLSPGSGIVLDYDSGTDTLTIHTSGVRSKTLTYFTPLDNQPPASNFATLDTRNSIAALDFDDTTEEAAVFVGIIPENAVLGSGISVRIHWLATSATTGSCRWGVQFEKMNTDLDSNSFDTATEDHSTTNGTSGIETVTSITCTSIDSLAAGDLFRLKIYRDVTDTTNDTMTGDAELIAVELRSVI